MAGLVPGPASHHHRSARWTARRLAVLSVAVALALLTLLAAPGRPDPSPIRAADPDPFLEVMRLLAFDEGKVLVVSPTGFVTDEDILGDVTGKGEGVNDVTNAGYAFLPSLPPWLLMRFACDGPGVACPSTGSAESVFAEGAYLFYERLAEAPESIAPAMRGEWGPVLALATYPTAPAGSSPFSRASHAIITRVQGTTSDVLYFAFQDGSFQMFRTSSRSLRSGNDLLTLVPKAKEIQTDPVGWDVYAYASNGTEAGTGRDNLRGFDGAAMLEFTGPPTIEFEDAPTTTTTTTSSSTTTTTSTSSQTSTSSTTTQATSTAASTGTSGGGGEIPWALMVIAGIGIALVGGFILLRGRGGGQGTTGGGPMTGGGGTVTGVVSGADPCPPLIAAAKAAREACDEARRAAATAADAARARAAEVDAARAELDKARRAREAAEQELARRQKPPDRGGDLASTTFGGRTVTEDSYDLHLLEEARAAANDAWEAAKAAATTDAERQAANDAWTEELKRLDGPDGIDEVRRRDKEGRATWVKEAEEALKTAQDAEAAAQAALDRAVAAAKAAQEAADAARQAADDACARADAAEKAAIDAGCLPPADGAGPGGRPAGGGAQPPAPEPPAPEPPTPPRPPEPPPTPPTPPPTPPTKPRPPRECPDDAEPRVTEQNAIEVDLYLISESQLKIDRNYPYGENVDEALDQLDQTLAATGLLTDLEGAVSSPVTSILGQLGVPGFDNVTDAPTDAAIKSMRKLRERMEKFRKTGTWSLSIPLQHYRFFCRVTEACVGGRWVETKREFVGERVGKPSWVESPPFEVQIVASDAGRAWIEMTANYTRQNAAAEQRIAAAAKACGG